MLAEIITIGDELLIGQVIDTNSAWLGQQLSLNGIRVKQITSVSDDPAHIVEALDAAKKRADIMIITGGLGPTKDDLTKTTLCDYFKMGWRMDAQILEDVIAIFKHFGRETTEINKLQARVPDGCIALRNKNGTAPGMWFEQEGKVFVSMPGVPYEMKGIFSESVLPMLRNKFGLPVIIHKTILTQGIGESMLAEKIADWEDSLAKEGIKLAYLPSPSLVRLRMSAEGKNKEETEQRVRKKLEEVLPLISGYVYGYDEDTLQDVLGKLLLEKKKTLSTAESCTGGTMAQMITSVSGSSAYFPGSLVAYSKEIKMQELGVKKETLESHGVVSRETVLEMAEGARKKFKTDYAVSTSGVAGPLSDDEGNEVGTVWIAVAGAEGSFAKKFQFGDNRGRNIERASITGLAMMRKFILGELRD